MPFMYSDDPQFKTAYKKKIVVPDLLASSSYMQDPLAV